MDIIEKLEACKGTCGGASLPKEVSREAGNFYTSATVPSPFLAEAISTIKELRLQLAAPGKQISFPVISPGCDVPGCKEQASYGSVSVSGVVVSRCPAHAHRLS